MEHTYLKTFYEVVKAGNFTKAAEILCVTQPAVSRRIQLLEKTYECELLDRTGKTLKPTTKGSILLAKVEKILEVEKELDLELRDVDNCFGFSLAVSPTFAAVHLHKIFDELMFVGPEKKKITITQVSQPEKILTGLQDGRYDLAIIESCLDFPMDENLKKLDLADADLVFAVSHDFNIFPGKTVLENLFQYTLYLRSEESCSSILLEKNLKALGFTKNNFMSLVEIDDMMIVLNNIAAGKGVTFLSSELLATTKQSQLLTTLKIPGFQHQRKRSLVFSKSYAKNPCHLLLTKIIENYFH